MVAVTAHSSNLYTSALQKLANCVLSSPGLHVQGSFLALHLWFSLRRHWICMHFSSITLLSSHARDDEKKTLWTHHIFLSHQLIHPTKSIHCKNSILQRIIVNKRYDVMKCKIYGWLLNYFEQYSWVFILLLLFLNLLPISSKLCSSLFFFFCVFFFPVFPKQILYNFSTLNYWNTVWIFTN